MIADEKIAEIRQVARISEFVSPYVTLKRTGRNLSGLCPFHAEKTPSFSVSDDGGFYHCFGCGAGGNVFKFVMQMENLTFPEAVRKVAAHYGIEVPEAAGSGPASERDRMLAILAAATRYFSAALARSGVGDAMASYLRERGVDAAAIERFSLGATPASGDGLAQYLRREGHDLGIAEKLGLVGMRGGSTYDRFRERLMFPIRDPQGRTVGFGARRLGEGDGPKYLNSSDSPVYHKSRVLYGLFEAREAARTLPPQERPSELILVEGYLDVIAMSQSGITNVVATCGTALTPDQARVMRRHGEEVVALFDGDDAGRRAAARSFPVFLEAGLWARGVFLPQGEDPDTYVRSHGADAMRHLLKAAVPLVDAYVRHISSGAAGASAAARVGAEMAGVLRKVENPFEYDVLVKKAAHWTGISEEVLRQQARATQKAPAPTAPGSRPVLLRSGPPGAEELLVALMLADVHAVERVASRDIVGRMREEPWSRIARTIIEHHGSTQGVDRGELLATIEEPARTRLTARLLDDPTFADEATRQRVLNDCLERLCAAGQMQERRRMLSQLRQLEEMGDEAGASALLAQWNARRNTDEE
ncbi:MAG TPA: DNA primase [Candidatus Limnocylindrales bacterium]|nr:DNA primase [Candidatus Limnocylindrales bacterium]